MSKLLLFVTATIFFMVGCSGKGNSEREREDSLRRADSLAQVEAVRLAQEAEEAAMEQARLDSFRKDSIAKAEMKDLVTLPLDIKSLCYKKDSKYYLRGNLTNIIERLGFKLMDSEKFYSDLITTDEYLVLCKRKIFVKEGIKIILEEAIEEGYIGNDSLEINFASSDLQKVFLENAQSIGFKKVSPKFYESGKEFDSGVCIWIDGNTLTIGYPGA